MQLVAFVTCSSRLWKELGGEGETYARIKCLFINKSVVEQKLKALWKVRPFRAKWEAMSLSTSLVTKFYRGVMRVACGIYCDTTDDEVCTHAWNIAVTWTSRVVDPAIAKGALRGQGHCRGAASCEAFASRGLLLLLRRCKFLRNTSHSLCLYHTDAHLGETQWRTPICYGWHKEGATSIKKEDPWKAATACALLCFTASKRHPQRSNSVGKV